MALNFLHLENNAEDDMSAQTLPEQRQPPSKSKIFMIRSDSLTLLHDPFTYNNEIHIDL